METNISFKVQSRPQKIVASFSFSDFLLILFFISNIKPLAYSPSISPLSIQSITIKYPQKFS